MIPGTVLPLDSINLSDNRWHNTLTKMGVKKVGIHHPMNEPKEGQFFDGLLKRCKVPEDKALFASAFVSYLGFHFEPFGLIFRDTSSKDFRVNNFEFKKLNFYVAESFDLGFESFKFGSPIVLLEGLLDAECFRYLVGYPYVIAYLSSYANDYISAFIGSMTDKVMIVPDSDAAGTNNVKYTTRNLSRFGVDVKVHITQCKDFGDVFSFNNLDDVQRASDALRNWR